MRNILVDPALFHLKSSHELPSTKKTREISDWKPQRKNEARVVFAEHLPFFVWEQIGRLLYSLL